MKIGMTAVQVIRKGRTAAIVVGTEDGVEGLWSLDGVWVPLIKAINRGENIHYFARPSGYSKDQPRSIVLKTDEAIVKLKERIDQLKLEEIPLDSDSQKALGGAILVKELPKKKPPVKGRSVGSENKTPERKHPSGLKFEVVKELEVALRSHNGNVRAAKRPQWSKATLPMIIRVYKRAAKNSSAGVDEKGKEISRHKRAMARVGAFLKLLFDGEPTNTKYTADLDALPETHPWRRTVEARRDITGS